MPQVEDCDECDLARHEDQRWPEDVNIKFQLLNLMDEFLYFPMLHNYPLIVDFARPINKLG